MLVEIFREPGDILGVGLSRCNDTQAIIIESMKQASLADRSGALNIGDILLSVGGRSVARCEVEQVTDIIRDQAGGSVRLEVLPGAYARTRPSVRASLPSPCEFLVKIKHTAMTRSFAKTTKIIQKPSDFESFL